MHDDLSHALDRLNQALVTSADHRRSRLISLAEFRDYVAPPVTEFVAAAGRTIDSESVVNLVRRLALGAGVTDPRHLQVVDELIAKGLARPSDRAG